MGSIDGPVSHCERHGEYSLYTGCLRCEENERWKRENPPKRAYCPTHNCSYDGAECIQCRERARYIKAQQRITDQAKMDPHATYTGVCLKHGRYVRRGLATCPYCAGAKPWKVGFSLGDAVMEDPGLITNEKQAPTPYGGRPYLPTEAQERKEIPVMSGCLDYFPLALCEVAKLSKKGNDQHNPGQPLHWARSKSTDEADTAIRHLIERGGVDTDGIRHSAKAAWRVLALLQKELEEARGLPISRGSTEK